MRSLTQICVWRFWVKITLKGVITITEEMGLKADVIFALDEVEVVPTAAIRQMQ